MAIVKEIHIPIKSYLRLMIIELEQYDNKIEIYDRNLLMQTIHGATLEVAQSAAMEWMIEYGYELLEHD